MAKKELENWEKVVEKKEKSEKKERTKILKVFYGLGRRKRSVARVWLYEEKGDITINGKTASDFFSLEKHKTDWQKPFHIVGISHPTAKFSGTIKVIGGGSTGQLGAITLGISRALLVYDIDYRQKLRQGGFLTRDSREVESKKVYLRKARKSPQYSKR
jgi:small subunit ribosomal protein S9